MPVRIVVSLLLLTIAACGSPEGPLERVAQYQALGNSHQVERLLALYADDARLDFGPLGIIAGKDRIRDIHDYDRAIQTTLRMEDCRLEARRVTCRTVERNDWLRAAGIDSIAYAASVFTFNEAGQIETVSATLVPASAEAMGGAMARFGAWAQANQSEEYASLFRKDGSFEYGYEGGKKVLALLKQWDASAQEVP